MSTEVTIVRMGIDKNQINEQIVWDHFPWVAARRAEDVLVNSGQKILLKKKETMRKV